jgi:hypothetical protein
MASRRRSVDSRLWTVVARRCKADSGVWIAGALMVFHMHVLTLGSQYQNSIYLEPTSCATFR